MRYSVIIPHCQAATDSARHELALKSVPTVDHGCELLTKFDNCPTVEHAIVAGLRAARGQSVVVLEPNDHFLGQISALLAALSRADFVCGRPRRRGLAKLRERLRRLPHWLVLGGGARDPHCLFWAARREVFSELPLAPRFVRYFPSLAARLGYRVDSVYIDGLTATGHSTAIDKPVSAVPRAASAGWLSVRKLCRRLPATENGPGRLRRQAQ